MEKKTFWLIWNEMRGLPRQKHDSYKSAENEAARLARKHPGEEFHILKVISTCRKKDIEWLSYPESHDEIPF